MNLFLLDVIAIPLPVEELIFHVENNKGFLFVLLIVLLVISMVIFNVFVLKKTGKRNENEDVDENNAEEKEE